MDPFAALDALEELAGPAPEDTGAAVAPELQAEKGRFDDFVFIIFIAENSLEKDVSIKKQYMAP